MSIAEIQSGDRLIAKEFLTVSEMTSLIAQTVRQLPTVASVDFADEGELSVELTTGQFIELQAVPMARAFNRSMDARHRALEDLVKRCA